MLWFDVETHLNGEQFSPGAIAYAKHLFDNGHMESFKHERIVLKILKLCAKAYESGRHQTYG